MAIIRIHELPSGSGTLTPDDLVVFMDDPSGSKSTRKLTVAEFASVIGVASSGNVFPYIELKNEPFIILPAVLGEDVSFTRTPEGNETDNIDEGLTLARGSNGALYNSEEQEGYDNSTHAIIGAEWNGDGWGNLLNTEIRSYGTLRSVLNNAIGENIVGAELIMHDTINDQYYKFLFSEWGENNGGSFAYTRTLISDPNPNFFEKTDYGSEVDTFVEDSPAGSGVGITRGNNNGIYNPYQESGWTEEVSPVGTEWNADGWEDLTNIVSRPYTNFYDAVGGQLGNKVPGSQLIMRLTGTQTYYAVQFINWTQGNNGGGFSYIKYQINLDELQEGITFSDGTVLKSAEGIGRVKSTESNNRRIEEVYGSKTVSVTEEGYLYLNSTTSRSETDTSIIYIDIEDQINNIANNYSNYVNTQSELEFSLDNSTWYSWTGAISLPTNERGYFLQDNPTLTYSVGDPVYFRYLGGGRPVVWWNKNELPGGAANFRGAVIDYHCYTGEGTFIGTIHIVDDDGEENITHTEVSSGSTDSENDDLWLVQNEGTISYRRMDGESKTAKFHWSAKVFYGSEFYD